MDKMRLSITISKTEEPRQTADSQTTAASQLFKEIISDFKDWQNSFSLLDKSNKRLITRTELKMVLYRQGLSLCPAAADRLFSSYALNGNFDYVKFLKHAEDSRPKPSLPELEQLRQQLKSFVDRKRLRPTLLFLQIDSNANKFVSVEELTSAFRAEGLQIDPVKLSALISLYTTSSLGLDYSQFSELFWGKELRATEDLMNSLSMLLLSKEVDLCNYLLSEDTIKSGVLNKEDFSNALTNVLAVMSQEESSRIFEILDPSRTGILQYKRLGILVRAIDVGTLTGADYELFSHFTEEFFDEYMNLQSALNAADEDKDGLVSLREWEQTFRTLQINFEGSKLTTVFKELAGTGKLHIEQFISKLQEKVWELSG